MDFIEGLPLSQGKKVIWVIVDRLKKNAHFIALNHPYTTEVLDQIFLQQIHKLHGLPASIVSNRDATFTSDFWREIFKLLGTRLHMSTAYHPRVMAKRSVSTVVWRHTSGV